MVRIRYLREAFVAKSHKATDIVRSSLAQNLIITLVQVLKSVEVVVLSSTWSGSWILELRRGAIAPRLLTTNQLQIADFNFSAANITQRMIALAQHYSDYIKPLIISTTKFSWCFSFSCHTWPTLALWAWLEVILKIWAKQGKDKDKDKYKDNEHWKVTSKQGWVVEEVKTEDAASLAASPSCLPAFVSFVQKLDIFSQHRRQ